MSLNKLVRDKIPEIIKNNDGKDPKIHVAEKEEYWKKLKEKIFEEVNEFLESENKEELADILEVIYAIAKFKEYNIEDIENTRKIKAETRGGFDKKIILEQ